MHQEANHHNDNASMQRSAQGRKDPSKHLLHSHKHSITMRRYFHLLLLVVALVQSAIHKAEAFSISSPTRSQMQGATRLPKKALMASPSASSERTVGWTIANLFRINDTLLAIYHAAGTAWDNLVPFGALLGAVAFQLGIYKPCPTLLQSSGDSAYWTGLIVMVLGVAKLFLMDIRQPDFPGMATQAKLLKSDFPKRVMDQSAWIGCGLAVIALLAVGGPLECGLAAGVDGWLQGLSLGTVAGSALGFYRQKQ